MKEKTYIQELFLYNQNPSPMRAVPLFIYEYNLMPKDASDTVFVNKELLQSKFNWYLVERLHIPAQYEISVWQYFGMWGINRLQSKDRKTTYYAVSQKHLLNDPVVL